MSPTFPKISRHAIDLNRTAERFREAAEELPIFLSSVRRDPRNLSLLMSTAIDVVSCGVAINSSDDIIWKAVKVAAQAGAAAFAGSDESEFTLQHDGESIIVKGPADESTLHASRWIQSFFLAGLCRDAKLLDILVATPVQRLRQSSTRDPEYRYLFAEALQSFWRQEQECTDLSLSALEATDATSEKSAAGEWSLYIDVPLIQCLIYVHTCDGEYDSEFPKAVEKHKQFWSRTKDRREDYRSLVSIQLSGLAAFAFERGMKLPVESEYVPSALIMGGGLDQSG